MKDKPDPIYAFPLGIDKTYYCYDPGMTLRDYFAAAALKGLLSLHWQYPEEMAKNVYQFADAMLKEREK